MQGDDLAAVIRHSNPESIKSLPTQSIWRVSNPTAKPSKPNIDDLFEPLVDALPVRITIYQDGVRTGWDDGAVGFEEGVVWFSGRATSFRIAAPDIDDSAYGNVPGGMKPSDHGLGLRHPTRRIKLEMTIIAMDGRREWTDALELAARLRRLRRAESWAGESQYPPLSPRPGLLPSRRQVALENLTFGSILALGSLTVVHRPDPNSILMLFIIVMGAFLWCLEVNYRKAVSRIAAEEAVPPSALVPPPAP